MIVAASTMLTYLQSLQLWGPVQNREMRAYKGFFRKGKEKRNIKYRRIKKENLLIIPYNNVKLFCLFVTKQVYMRLQHLETHHICTSVSLDNAIVLIIYFMSTASVAKEKIWLFSNLYWSKFYFCL